MDVSQLTDVGIGFTLALITYIVFLPWNYGKKIFNSFMTGGE